MWPNTYDHLEGPTLLVAPWVSAYDQGMVISALVRGYRMTKRPRLMDLLQGAHHIFEIEAHDGGVRELLGLGASSRKFPAVRFQGFLMDS